KQLTFISRLAEILIDNCMQFFKSACAKASCRLPCEVCRTARPVSRASSRPCRTAEYGMRASIEPRSFERGNDNMICLNCVPDSEASIEPRSFEICKDCLDETK